jgi:hypothetical protein
MTSPQADVRLSPAPRRHLELPSRCDWLFPIKTDPVKIDAAIVGWTIKDQFFGVKFLQIHPAERFALEQFMAGLTLGTPHKLF